MKMQIWNASADNEKLIAQNAVTTYQEWLIVDVREATNAGLILFENVNPRKSQLL